MKSIFWTIVLYVSLCISASALVPPQYLSVPKWQACVNTVKKGSATFLCLPKDKPLNCPTDSWNTLKNQHLIDPCKGCGCSRSS